MKDILVDTMIAKNFSHPIDPSYKQFIRWLMKDGSIVVCNYLLHEYHRTCSSSLSNTSICLIIDMQIREGRLNKISNKKIKEFKFKKKDIKRLRSHNKDHKIIKCVLLSDRKYIITKEINILYDINNYPGFNAMGVNHPNKIRYK